MAKKRARVALFVGCAADAFFPQTTLATARVLQRNGCEVWIPRPRLLRSAALLTPGWSSPPSSSPPANCEAFGPGLAQGLEASMPSSTTPAVAARSSRSMATCWKVPITSKQATSSPRRCKDITEFLVELGPIKPTHPLPIKATYHDACGLAHAQKIRSQPRAATIPHPRLGVGAACRERHCCGAAGSYNITQPEMANLVGARKARNIVDSGAEAVFMGNVGCQLQILRQLRLLKPEMWVAHPVDALWASYSGKGRGVRRQRRTFCITKFSKYKCSSLQAR